MLLPTVITAFGGASEQLAASGLQPAGGGQAAPAASGGGTIRLPLSQKLPIQAQRLQTRQHPYCTHPPLCTHPPYTSHAHTPYAHPSAPSTGGGHRLAQPSCARQALRALRERDGWAIRAITRPCHWPWPFPLALTLALLAWPRASLRHCPSPGLLIDRSGDKFFAAAACKRLCEAVRGFA